VRWRPHYLWRIELFIGGITLSAAVGYALGVSVYGVAATLIVAALLVMKRSTPAIGPLRRGHGRLMPAEEVQAD
jgi:hypothetical protein